jgi:hemolysin activation/secretion protein
MLLKVFIFLFLCISIIHGENEKSLIAIVKISKAKVRDRAIPDNKYIVDYYKLGDVFYLDYCDRYDWCKVKDKELYLSKATLGVMDYTPKTIKKEISAVQTIEKKEKEIPCFQLKQIDLGENELFSKDKQKELLEKYIGNCIDAQLLKDILNTVSAYYIDEGYITTKPYFTPQNIKDGQVDIAVSKGYIKDIVHSETNSSDGRIATAFMFQKGGVLNLRDLETSLEMINRVPSYSSKFEIKPAQEVGQSIVSINTNKTRPYRLMLGVTGEKQDYDDNPYLNADLSIDNLLNINDILTIRYNGSKVQSYYQSNTGTEIDYSFALSSYVLSYTWFEYKYSQAVLGLNDTYRSSGDTVGSNLKISKVLHRNQNNKLEAAVSLQYKNNKNYFSNQLIDVSS